MSAPTLNAKYLRSYHVYPAPNNGQQGCMSWIMRLVYEFWGFCVNGDNNLVSPGLGSMANSQATGSYINMPVGWESGSNVLLASGSDGTTQAGLPYFTTVSTSSFSPTMVGKYLTTWKSGSLSTDDSIYPITKWLSSASVMIDPTYGATSLGPSGSVTQLTTRTNINYRVIDFKTAAQMSWNNGNYVVLQFSNASDINPGQARSQAQVQVGDGFHSTATALSVVLSPSGSWDGTHFVGESYTEIDADGGLGGPGAGGFVAPDWFHNSGGGDGYVTIIAGLGFIICQAGGNFMPSGGGSSFHIEVPIRLYPQANDPNPICGNNFGNCGVATASQPGWGYASFHFPSPYDTLTRRWACQVRGYTGSYWNSGIWGGTQQTLNMGRFPSEFFNQRTRKFLLPEPVLSLGTVNGQTSVVGQFCLARARLRSVRYIAGGYPYYMRIGDDTDRWIHAGGGVMWPWDNAIMARRQMFAGF